MWWWSIMPRPMTALRPSGLGLRARFSYTPPADLTFPHVLLPKPLSEGVPTILSASVNGGFAAGVNIGLRHLFADPAIQRVWILNPDSVIPPGTPLFSLVTTLAPLRLWGTRSLLRPPGMIQIDGGTLNRRTGVTGNANLGAPHQLADAAGRQARLHHRREHGRQPSLLGGRRADARGLFPLLRRGRLGPAPGRSATCNLWGHRLPSRRHCHRVAHARPPGCTLLALLQASRAAALRTASLPQNLSLAWPTRLSKRAVSLERLA